MGFYLSSDAIISDSDQLLCTVTEGSLGAASQVAIQTTCEVPLISTGDYFIGAIADPLDQVAESDETNNAAASTATVAVTAPDVDLEYELLWVTGFSGPEEGPGESVTYHVQVRNNGSEASPSGIEASIHYSTDANFTLSNASTCNELIGSVPALTITEFTFDCDVPTIAPGWYYSGVIINGTNALPESDETNNHGGDLTPRLIQ